ncbi:response regulator [Candidatus Manganitrophus noduliformans]|uniref:histidine kinase n=1 Tax=Candidatus Manganitrophus noduliformans TaxID=2606439 RepID=A0A7X6DRJ0_9BACT|nr:response regulator [Candidatus Manganitrophus noduliformans]NKE72032.1 response regulator [Candidatus Manganitrophus noduliformans]
MVDTSRKTGLRKKIVSAMVIMAILPVLLGLIVTSWRGTTELRKAIGNNFEGLAKEAASKTDLGVQKEIAELHFLGDSIEIQEALQNALSPAPKGTAAQAALPTIPSDPKVSAFLNRAMRLPETQAVLQSLIITNNVGQQIASSAAAPANSSFLADEIWWKESARGEKGAVYIGALYQHDQDATDFLFDIAMPVLHKESGEFLGILKATLHLKPFLQPFIYPIRFGSTGHAMLIDSSGVVLICPILPTGSHVADPVLLQRITEDRSGWMTAQNDGHGGTNSIVGFAPVSAVNQLVSSKGGKQWHSFIRQEPKETYEPVQSLIRTVFLYGSLLVGFTGALGFVVAGKLVRPLLLLHEGAEHIRKGDLGYRLQVKTDDEIEALADKFNEMAEKLSESYATLEHKVLSRTRELQALNQIATTANQSLELQGLLDTTLEKVIEVTGFESGYVEIFNPSESRLVMKSHFGISSPLLNELHAAGNLQISLEVVDTRAPVILEQADVSETTNPLINAGYQTLIVFPVQSKNKIIGAFTLASRTARSFTAQDLQLLSSIGNQVGTAVENAHLFQKEQETVEKLMEMDRIKSEFLSNVSHELRTPLTSIIGFSEILLDRLAGALSPDQESYVRNMNTSGQHLLEIINNLLDLSKIKAGKMEIHPHLFSLRSLLETIQQTVIPMTYKKGLHFDLSVDEGVDMVYTDEGKVKQILLNILGNAIKFTPAKGSVQLQVRAGRLGRARAIEISIRDTGIGIPTHALSKIFDEFQQIDGSYTRDYPGTGLGLAITKRFVDILGGEIQVESRSGSGSTFRVSIPIPEERDVQPPPIQTFSSSELTARADAILNIPGLSEGAEEDRPRILVVEDDPAVAKLLALYLTQEGYAVVHAYDGQDAIEKAQEIKPFAITLDIMLPRIDGWEVLKKLKTLPTTKDIPVIIVSIVENPTLGFSLGAVDYFTKPINRKGLIDSLKKYSITQSVIRKPINFLVIEQDTVVMEQIGSILDEERFGVIKTNNGEEGIALAVEIQPDLILLDLMLNNISGIETIHRLKQHPTARNIPIILFASRELTAEEKQILDGQVREIIYKNPSLKETLIQEVRKFEKLYPDKAKMIDGLTGLYNERYLNNRLADEVNRAFRYKRPFSILISNVDQFRLFNRRYGTEAGNHVLREIAIIYRRNTRSSNPLCRGGGSTFILMMPETTRESAKMAAEKLRRLVESYDFSIPGKQSIEMVTVSIGTATFFDDADTAERMIIHASNALKNAQEQGGNCTMSLDRVRT